MRLRNLFSTVQSANKLSHHLLQRLYTPGDGRLEHRMYLIMVDAHSKWIEAFPMTSTTATKTIQILRTTFARYVIPESIVSDNDP